MAKFTKLMEHLIKDNVVVPQQVLNPIKASYDDLITTHTPNYVKNFITGSITAEELKRTGFQWSEGLANRCQMEVGMIII